ERGKQTALRNGIPVSYPAARTAGPVSSPRYGRRQPRPRHHATEALAGRRQGSAAARRSVGGRTAGAADATRPRAVPDTATTSTPASRNHWSPTSQAP